MPLYKARSKDHPEIVVEFQLMPWGEFKAFLDEHPRYEQVICAPAYVKVNQGVFVIYQVTNTINQKSYVGFTSKFPSDERWKEHQQTSRRAPKTHFHWAIRKYGAENFKLKVLEEGWDPKIGKDIRESYWISVLKPEYNMTEGGDGTLGYRFSKEQNENNSIRQRGKQYTLGTMRSEKWKAAHSVVMKRANSRGPKGIIYPRITCPHCNRIGGGGAMRHYHFDKCKRKVN